MRNFFNGSTRSAIGGVCSPLNGPKIAQVIFLGSILLLIGTPACPQTDEGKSRREDLRQEVNGMAQKMKDFFAMLKEGERKRRELAEQNQENVRKNQEKAREAREASRRLQEETRRKTEEARLRQEEARMRQKEQLRTLQDRRRR